MLMATLKRTISWQVFSLYGLGNILGAGIYVLVGEVAAEAGEGLLWSFILAGIIATFTALTYSALAQKYPVSAGAAVYAERAFQSRSLSTAIGLSLAFTGIVSASTLLRGFYRYYSELFPEGFLGNLPDYTVILLVLLALGLIAYKGIKESAAVAVIMTLLESAGLAIIIALAVTRGDFAHTITSSVGSITTVEPHGLLLGAFLAFYAFIGFEDMINLAEEVKKPKTSLKKGMLSALGAATLLYVLTAIAALAILTTTELAQSQAPLSDVFKVATGSTLPVITIIGLFAVVNGVIAQIIMSSRVLYGMSREGLLPKIFSSISEKRKTPHHATTVTLLFIACGSLLFPLDTLAKVTSLALLIIFSIVHVAAVRLIKSGALELNVAIPVLGILTNMGIIFIQIASWLGISA